MQRTLWLLVAGSFALGGSPTEKGPDKVEVDGLHNVLRIADQLYSGSGPDSEKSFASLRKLGIKTVISVDGARPNLELAKKHGLRYVHVPIGYNGMSHSQVVRLAKAVKEVPGPIYIHCHHGKHRGPTAAAVAQLCADENCKVATALEILKKAGTDPKYKGLFASIRNFQRPSNRELASVGVPPEAVRAAGLTQAMVSIDNTWDHLILVRAAGWKTPKDHPDLDPRQEVGQLIQHYREVSELPKTKDRPADFLRKLADARAIAKDLESILGSPTVDAGAAEKAFAKANQACTRCHAKYRDEPRK